jgi:hypothetical protein
MIPNNNIIMILNIINEEFDFNDHLSSYNSLYIKNCSNLIINISNKITKIIIEKSDKIYLQICDLIVGIEINSSKNIILQVNCIPYIGLYKSTLFLQGSINKYLLTLVESYKSSLYNL